MKTSCRCIVNVHIGLLSMVVVSVLSFMDDSDFVIVPVRRKDDSETAVFDAFGHRYHVSLAESKLRSLDDVPVYTSRRSITRRESLVTDEDVNVDFKPVNVYTDGDTMLAIKRQSMAGGWQPRLDGVINRGGEEVYMRSRPNMMFHDSFAYNVHRRDSPGRTRPNMMFHDGLGHLVQRRQSSNLHDSYITASEQVSAMIDRWRRGRQNIKAVVDMLVVVDNAIYRKELEDSDGDEAKTISEIKNYYNLLISMVDMRYKRIEDPQLSIRIRLSGIHIAVDPESAPWSEQHLHPVEEGMDVLDPRLGLEKFHEWLQKEYAKGTLPDYDHAMGFTGYRMFNVKTGHPASGMAYIGTICKVVDGYSASVIEETGGFSNVGTCTHELGHSLGAKHDGEDGSRECPAAQNFIMTPQNTGDLEVMRNFFNFSPCAINAFKETLGRRGDCLFDSDPDDASGELPGGQFGLDAQCREVFGPDSGPCHINRLMTNVCLRLWCRKPSKPTSCVTTMSLSAIYGTPCSDGKICMYGECRAKGDLQSITTNVVMDCPHGDVDQAHCLRILFMRPDSCVRPDIKKFCCLSCRRF